MSSLLQAEQKVPLTAMTNSTLAHHVISLNSYKTALGAADYYYYYYKCQDLSDAITTVVEALYKVYQ